MKKFSYPIDSCNLPANIPGSIMPSDMKAVDIAKCAVSLKLMFSDVIVVTTQDLTGVIDGVKILSPEEFEEYVTGVNKN